MSAVILVRCVQWSSRKEVEKKQKSKIRSLEGGCIKLSLCNDKRSDGCRGHIWEIEDASMWMARKIQRRERMEDEKDESRGRRWQIQDGRRPINSEETHTNRRQSAKDCYRHLFLHVKQAEGMIDVPVNPIHSEVQTRSSGGELHRHWIGRRTGR